MATLQFTEGGKTPPRALYRNKQLSNNIVDGMARSRPSAVYSEIPRLFDSYEAGYRKVTYGALANGINAVAGWLKEKLGESQNHQTLAYIGLNDLGYVMMILGAVKAGYKLLLLSLRNNINDHTSVLEATGCQILLTPTSRSPIVQGILKANPLQIFDSPSLEELLVHDYPHYPYVKTFAEARNEPLVVLHTSGTTAVPKPIVYSHDFVASYIQSGQLEPPPGFESQVSLMQSNRVFVALPFFYLSLHNLIKTSAGNLFATMFDGIANQSVAVLPLAGAMPSAQIIVDGLKRAQADAILIAPPFLEQIAKSPEILEFITSNVETVTYGGGDVSQWSGDALASKVKLFNFNGSTETAIFPLLRPSGDYPSEDWKYMHPHPAAGLEFRPSTDGLFEAVIIRNTTYEDEQRVFKIFPHLKEYPTKDLWAPHPSKTGLWTYHGRADDTFNTKSGYLCDPIPMEHNVSKHPEVRAILMVGNGRFQPALIIERVDDQPMSPAAEQKLNAELWPLIQEANQKYKWGARVSKSHILYTTPQQPMRRAGKGTVQRGPTLELYKDALDALYAREGDVIPEKTPAVPDFDPQEQ